jgi:hypothetical protein
MSYVRIRDFRTDLRGQLESGFTQLEPHLSGFVNLRMLESSERMARLTDVSSSDNESGNNEDKCLVLTSSQHCGHVLYSCQKRPEGQKTGRCKGRKTQRLEDTKGQKTDRAVSDTT